MSNDQAATLHGWADRAGITFPLLSDTGLAAIRAYGVLNERQEIAHPASFVIDRSGVVRYAREDIDYRVRPSADELLAAVRALRPAKPGDAAR